MFKSTWKQCLALALGYTLLAPFANAQTQPVPPPQAPQREPILVQGTAINLLADNQILVRTADGKDMVVSVDPQTTYTWNEKPANFADLRPGSHVHIHYDVRDQRNIARSVRGMIPPQK